MLINQFPLDPLQCDEYVRPHLFNLFKWLFVLLTFVVPDLPFNRPTFAWFTQDLTVFYASSIWNNPPFWSYSVIYSVLIKLSGYWVTFYQDLLKKRRARAVPCHVEPHSSTAKSSTENLKRWNLEPALLFTLPTAWQRYGWAHNSKANWILVQLLQFSP